MPDKGPGPTTPEAPKESRADLKKKLDEISGKLKKLDAQKFGGAPERGPRARMLDVSRLEASDPEHHYRFVNADDPAKVQMRIEDEGYERVSDAEAEKHGARATVGEGILMRNPREKYEERVARQKELGRRRLEAHKTELRKAVEAVAKELRDQHGINVPVDRLLVDED